MTLSYIDNKLFEAILTNNLGDVDGAIKYGADVNATENGCTPLHFVQYSTALGAQVVFTILPGIHHDGVYTPLKCTKVLIEHGASAKAANKFGEKPLHAAAYCNDKETVALFIEHGADVNAKTDNGFTPLSLALRGIDVEVIEILLKHGADAKADERTLEKLNSALDYAIVQKTHNPELYNHLKSNVQKIIELLEKHGANLSSLHSKLEEFLSAEAVTPTHQESITMHDGGASVTLVGHMDANPEAGI